MATHVSMIRSLISVNSLVILYIFLSSHAVPVFAQEDAINQNSVAPAPIIGEHNGPYFTRRILSKFDHQPFSASELSAIQNTKSQFPNVHLRAVTPRVLSVTADQYLQLRSFVRAVQNQLPNIQACLDPIVLQSGQGGDLGLSGSGAGGNVVTPQPVYTTPSTNPFNTEPLAMAMTYVYDSIGLPEAFTNFTQGFGQARIALFDTGPTAGEGDFIGNEFKSPVSENIYGTGINLAPHGSMSYSLLASQQNGRLWNRGLPGLQF